MSSLVFVSTEHAIHMVTDGAAYRPSDGVITSLEQKIAVLNRQKVVIYARGPSRSTWQAGLQMSCLFDSFDDIVDGLEEFMRKFYADCFDAFSVSGHPELEFYVFGWSDRVDEPEVYMIRCAPPGSWIEERAGKTEYATPPFRAVKVSANFAATPAPTPEERKAALFPSKPAESIRPEIDLLHFFEMQRRIKTNPPGEFEDDAPKRYTVGGYALLTTITKDEIRQKVLARYDDKVGKAINPEPIDWAAWKAEHDPSAMSRVKREMAERKARKGARR